MSLAGMVSDVRKSAARLYINNFVDSGRQNTMDLLLVHSKPKLSNRRDDLATSGRLNFMTLSQITSTHNWLQGRFIYSESNIPERTSFRALKHYKSGLDHTISTVVRPRNHSRPGYSPMEARWTRISWPSDFRKLSNSPLNK